MTEEKEQTSAEQAYATLREAFYTGLEAAASTSNEEEIIGAVAGSVGIAFDLAGMIFLSLARIATAQEEMVRLAKRDFDAEVKTASEHRSEEIVKDKAQRSYIGKKSD